MPKGMIQSTIIVILAEDYSTYSTTSASTGAARVVYFVKEPQCGRVCYFDLQTWIQISKSDLWILWDDLGEISRHPKCPRGWHLEKIPLNISFYALIISVVRSPARFLGSYCSKSCRQLFITLGDFKLFWKHFRILAMAPATKQLLLARENICYFCTSECLPSFSRTRTCNKNGLKRPKQIEKSNNEQCPPHAHNLLLTNNHTSNNLLQDSYFFSVSEL